MKGHSECRFCLVQVDSTYQPWQKWCSLPPCVPYLATSNIAPNNQGNTRYNDQCCQKGLFATVGGQILHIDHAIYLTTPSNDWRHEWLGGQQGPSIGSIPQHTIQKEASGGEETGIALVKQRREWGIDWGLCGYRDHLGNKASWRYWDSDYA